MIFSIFSDFRPEDYGEISSTGAFSAWPGRSFARVNRTILTWLLMLGLVRVEWRQTRAMFWPRPSIEKTKAVLAAPLEQKQDQYSIDQVV